MTRRYERASTVLTSNKGFEEWGEVFGDEVMAAALIDRLVHHCHLVTVRGNSYRCDSTPSPGNPCTRRPTTRRRLAAGAPAGGGDDLRLVPWSTVRFSIGGSVRFSAGADSNANNSQ